MVEALFRGNKVRRRIEKPEWTVVGGYEVEEGMDMLLVTWRRGIVLPSDQGGRASSMKDEVAASHSPGGTKACKGALAGWERMAR